MPHEHEEATALTRDPYTAYFDGSCSGKTCGVGYIIKDPAGAIICRESKSFKKKNWIEERALYFLMLKLHQLKVKYVRIYGDGKNAIDMVSSETDYRIPFINECRTFMRKYPNWSLHYTKKENNGKAHRLAHKAVRSH